MAGDGATPAGAALVAAASAYRSAATTSRAPAPRSRRHAHLVPRRRGLVSCVARLREGRRQRGRRRAETSRGVERLRPQPRKPSSAPSTLTRNSRRAAISRPPRTPLRPWASSANRRSWRRRRLRTARAPTRTDRRRPTNASSPPQARRQRKRCGVWRRLPLGSRSAASCKYCLDMTKRGGSAS